MVGRGLRAEVWGAGGGGGNLKAKGVEFESGRVCRAGG